VLFGAQIVANFIFFSSHFLKKNFSPSPELPNVNDLDPGLGSERLAVAPAHMSSSALGASAIAWLRSGAPTGLAFEDVLHDRLASTNTSIDRTAPRSPTPAMPSASPTMPSASPARSTVARSFDASRRLSTAARPIEPNASHRIHMSPVSPGRQHHARVPVAPHTSVPDPVRERVREYAHTHNPTRTSASATPSRALESPARSDRPSRKAAPVQ
jgi:hypothetical protein